MGELGDELRKAREYNDMSLEDVNYITKIDVKILQALEDENFDILPEPYVRAFLKSYAAAVGLNEAKIMSEYEALREPQYDEFEPPPAEHHYKNDFEAYVEKAADILRNKLLYVLGAIGGVIVIVIALILICRPAPDRTADTLEEPAAAAVEQQGFTFSAAADESLYLMVSIDGGDSLDYNLVPESVKEFYAERNIWLLTSNAGATRFSLNGKKLKKVGAEGWSAQISVDSTGITKIKTYQPISLP